MLELFWTLCRGSKVVLHEGELFGKQQISSDQSSSEGSHALPQSTFASGSAGDGTTPLELGLYFFAADKPALSGGKYDLLMECCKFADTNGFSSIWTPERHFHEFGGAYPNASVISAAIAAITNHVRICAGSLSPLHDPIRIAEEWAVVDNLSNGRIAISFATGWQPDDFVLAPHRYKNRHDEFLDGIDLVRKLWRGENMTLDGPVGSVNLRRYPV